MKVFVSSLYFNYALGKWSRIQLNRSNNKLKADSVAIKDYKMDIKDMKSKIDSNTICVYTSYPNYPYGTVDPID